MGNSVMRIEYTCSDDLPFPQKTIVEAPIYTYDDFDLGEIDGIKELFGRFLHFIGYPFFDKEWTFLESVDGDEYEILEAVLKKIRESEDFKQKIKEILGESGMDVC